MLEHATDTVSFFQAMAPVLIANVLTVAFSRENSSKGTQGRGRRTADLFVARHPRLLIHAVRPLRVGVYPL